VNQLNWHYIAFAVAAPPLVGLLFALPFWWKGRMTFGNVVATGVVFGSAIALILREYVEIDRLTQECLDAGTVCWPVPSAFTRFAIYAFIGLMQVIALFSLSVVVEDRARRRQYSPEWR
jgi:hypothetical protein